MEHVKNCICERGIKMKREFLEGLGLTKEQMDSVLSEHHRAVGEVKSKVESLKEEIKGVRAEAEGKVIANAILQAIGESAMDRDIVAGLIDKSQITIADDGSISGITEQIDNIKAEKGFLFKQEPKAELKGIQPVEGSEPKMKSVSEMNYSELCRFMEENPQVQI